MSDPLVKTIMRPRTLGSELRAGRMRFQWSPPFGAYVRIKSNDRDGGFRLEVCKPDALPISKRPDVGPFTIWWEDDTMRAEVDRLVQRLGYGTHECDEDGVPREAAP